MSFFCLFFFFLLLNMSFFCLFFLFGVFFGGGGVREEETEGFISTLKMNERITN